MFSYYSTPWLTASYSLPIAYSQMVWWSMTYPYTFATELLNSYWQLYSDSRETKSSDQVSSPKLSVPELESVATVTTQIAALPSATVTETTITPFEKTESVATEDELNNIKPEMKWDRIIKVTLKDVVPIQPEVEISPSPPPRLENPKRVLKLLQSLAIAKPEDINKLTLDRTQSLAKALEITQSVNGQKKKAPVLKKEVTQKLQALALLET